MNGYIQSKSEAKVILPRRGSLKLDIIWGVNKLAREDAPRLGGGRKVRTAKRQGDPRKAVVRYASIGPR